MARRLWSIIEQTFTRFSNNDGITLAAATAYYAAFSFFPLLWVLITGLGFALKFSESAQNAKQQLLELLAERTSPALTEQVQNSLSDVQLGASSYGLFGPVILLFGAIGIFSQMEFAFDRLWHNVGPRDHGIRAAIKNALWNRLKAFMSLLALGVLLLVVFISDLTLAAVRKYTDQLPAGSSIWELTQLAFSIGLNTIVLSLLFQLMPRRRVRWLHALCGGLVTAVVWQIGNEALSRFMTGGTYSAYGVVGSFIVIMLWVYCASVLLYLGGQLVQVLGHPYEPPLTEAQRKP
ncbi:MAG: YihY/virulence factor BrkB family protein [Pirellulales bacterium]